MTPGLRKEGSVPSFQHRFLQNQGGHTQMPWAAAALLSAAQREAPTPAAPTQPARTGLGPQETPVAHYCRPRGSPHREPSGMLGQAGWEVHGTVATGSGLGHWLPSSLPLVQTVD